MQWNRAVRCLNLVEKVGISVLLIDSVSFDSAMPTARSANFGAFYVVPLC
jgi:hypothetical protein